MIDIQMLLGSTSGQVGGSRGASSSGNAAGSHFAAFFSAASQRSVLGEMPEGTTQLGQLPGGLTQGLPGAGLQSLDAAAADFGQRLWGNFAFGGSGALSEQLVGLEPGMLQTMEEAAAALWQRLADQFGVGEDASAVRERLAGMDPDITQLLLFGDPLAGENGAEPDFNALLTQLIGRLPDEDLDSLVAGLAQDLGLPQQNALFETLLEPLSQAEQSQLLEQLGALVPQDQQAAFRAELEQAGSLEERAALLSRWTPQLSPAEQLGLFEQFTQQLSSEERSELVLRLSEELPDAQRNLLLAGLGFAGVTTPAGASVDAGQVSLQAAAGSPAQMTARTAPQPGTRAPAQIGAPNVVLTEAAVTAQAGIRVAAEPGIGLSTQTDTSGARSNAGTGLTSFAQQVLRSSPEQGAPVPDPLADAPRTLPAPGLRDAMATIFARHNDGPEQQPGGAGLRPDSGLLGLASLGTNTSTGMAGSPSPAAWAPSLSAPVGSTGWNQQLGQQLAVMTQRGGEQHVELRLHPRELGPLTISLKVVEQATHVQFVAANAQTRAAVEQALPMLREALAEQGIELGDTSVGEQSREQAEASFAGGEGQGSGTASAGPSEASGANDALGTPAGSDERPLNLDGRVDLYA